MQWLDAALAGRLGPVHALCHTYQICTVHHLGVKSDIRPPARPVRAQPRYLRRRSVGLRGSQALRGGHPAWSLTVTWT